MEAQCDRASVQNQRPLSSRQLPTDLFGVMLLQSVGAYGPFQNCSLHLAAVAPLAMWFRTFSQVRSGSDLSEPWQDSGNAQGIVLSPLLFNILVDGLARAVHVACPGISLKASWDSRFAGQLCADDLVVVADSAEDLQTGLDAVSAW